MPRKPKSEAYEVGYGKPPVEHRFRAGGKKPVGSGRKKGAKNSRTLIEEAFCEKVKVTLSGETRTMTKKELLIRLALDKAIKSPLVKESNALVQFYFALAPECVDPPPHLIVESIPGDEGL